MPEQLPVRSEVVPFSCVCVCVSVVVQGRPTKSKVYTEAGQVVGLLVAAPTLADKLSPLHSLIFFLFFWFPQN